MKDFEWTDTLWAVVKADGCFAGCPCLTHEEAFELSAQHEGSHIFCMNSKFVQQVWDDEEEEEDINACMRESLGGGWW